MEREDRRGLKRELARALAREFDRYRLVVEGGRLMVEAEVSRDEPDLSEEEEKRLREIYEECTACDPREEGYEGVADCIEEKAREVDLPMPDIGWGS